MKKDVKISDLLVRGGVLLILTAVILLICFFLYGETEITNERPEIEKTEAITCNISDTIYPFVSYDNAQSKTTRINVVFDDDKPSVISLVHTLYYNNEKSIIDSENLNHINLNKNFSKDNLGFDALGLKFSKFADGLQMSLYAEGDELNNNSMKYFMLDNIADNSYNMESMQKFYEERGFECEVNN